MVYEALFVIFMNGCLGENKINEKDFLVHSDLEWQTSFLESNVE